MYLIELISKMEIFGTFKIKLYIEVPLTDII